MFVVFGWIMKVITVIAIDMAMAVCEVAMMRRRVGRCVDGLLVTFG